MLWLISAVHVVNVPINAYPCFQAARETGIFADAAFEDYYVRFIGHFVSVYEQKAPPFARESARWSMNEVGTHQPARAVFCSHNYMFSLNLRLD